MKLLAHFLACLAIILIIALIGIDARSTTTGGGAIGPHGAYSHSYLNRLRRSAADIMNEEPEVPEQQLLPQLYRQRRSVRRVMNEEPDVPKKMNQEPEEPEVPRERRSIFNNEEPEVPEQFYAGMRIRRSAVMNEEPEAPQQLNQQFIQHRARRATHNKGNEPEPKPPQQFDDEQPEETKQIIQFF